MGWNSQHLWGCHHSTEVIHNGTWASMVLVLLEKEAIDQRDCQISFVGVHWHERDYTYLMYTTCWVLAYLYACEINIVSSPQISSFPFIILLSLPPAPFLGNHWSVFWHCGFFAIIRILINGIIQCVLFGWGGFWFLSLSIWYGLNVFCKTVLKLNFYYNSVKI